LLQGCRGEESGFGHLKAVLDAGSKSGVDLSNPLPVADPHLTGWYPPERVKPTRERILLSPRHPQLPHDSDFAAQVYRRISERAHSGTGSCSAKRLDTAVFLLAFASDCIDLLAVNALARIRIPKEGSRSRICLPFCNTRNVGTQKVAP